MRRGAVGAMVALVAGVGVAALTGGARAASGCLLPILCPTTSTTTSTATLPFPFPFRPAPVPRPAPPAADAGATYYGRSGNVHDYATVSVSKNGGHLRYATFYFASGGCSDGGSYAGYDVASLHGFTKMRGGAVGKNGAARFGVHYAKAYSFTRRGRRVNGTERFTARVRFAGESATVDLSDRFLSRHLRCDSGPLRLTLWRGGTRQSPLRTANVHTGRYIGRSDYGDSMTVYTSSPLRLIIRVAIRFGHRNLFCTRYLFSRGTILYQFGPLPLRGGRFAYHLHFHASGNGLSDSVRIGLTGYLNGSAAYATWGYISVSRMHGRYVGYCETSRTGDRFTLRFKSH